MAAIPTSTTVDLVEQYQIPSQFVPFIDNRFLIVVKQDWAEKCVEFCLPSRTVMDRKGRVTLYSVCWIHPDFNKDCCHYFEREPGDLPHFYAVKDTTDVGSDPIDGIETIDDLADWLRSMRSVDE